LLLLITAQTLVALPLTAIDSTDAVCPTYSYSSVALAEAFGLFGSVTDQCPIRWSIEAVRTSSESSVLGSTAILLTGRLWALCDLMNSIGSDTYETGSERERERERERDVQGFE
jgi:hypothetical protein